MMDTSLLRVAAFCSYLTSWVVFAICAVIAGLPRIRKEPAPVRINAAVAAGIALQVASPMVITFSLGGGPLHPTTFELVGVLLLAPAAAALFAGAVLSAPRKSEVETLVTSGVYSWLRHPIYLAFLGMLAATGLLRSDVVRLVIAILIYVAGSELRIAWEEKALARKFHAQYEQYRQRTRWRYLPGLR